MQIGAIRHDVWWESQLRQFWSTQQAVSTRRILVVDDDRALSTLVALVLRESGFMVDVANSGEDALQRAQAQPPDAVILDLRMPGKDGRATFRELRQLGVNAPVLILSAFDARQAQEELGAEGFVNKPFEPDRLVNAVRSVLRIDE